jgi:hypothetical protein
MVALMRRHRGFLYGLAVVALSAFMAQRADAGSITLDVDLNGTVIFSTTSSSPNTTISDVSSAANAALLGAHSIYRFVSLGGSSNFPGDGEGFLQVNSQIKITSGANTASLSVDAFQSGFTAPTGPSGTVTHGAGGSTSPSASGSIESWGNFNGTPTTTLAFAAPAASFSGNTSMPVAPVPTGYELSVHQEYQLAGSSVGSTAGMTSTTTVTAIPEPASLTMLLTGLPMPLVLVGLLRRRKAKA